MDNHSPFIIRNRIRRIAFHFKFIPDNIFSSTFLLTVNVVPVVWAVLCDTLLSRMRTTHEFFINEHLITLGLLAVVITTIKDVGKASQMSSTRLQDLTHPVCNIF